MTDKKRNPLDLESGEEPRKKANFDVTTNGFAYTIDSSGQKVAAHVPFVRLNGKSDLNQIDQWNRLNSKQRASFILIQESLGNRESLSFFKWRIIAALLLTFIALRLCFSLFTFSVTNGN
jgi:hypothetical protein